MRISVNLASRPFVEIRPLLARLRIVMAIFAVLAIALGTWLHFVSAQAAAAQARIDAVRARTSAVERARLANESRMRQPVNRAVLDRSHFLNGAFASKSFSWTAVMMDLERVLPSGVQVTSIEPQIAKDGSVTIRLRVSGDRDRAVTLVRNLEHSSRFLAPRLTSETTQAAPQGATARQIALTSVLPGAVEFDILSGYNPLPDNPAQAGRATISSVPAAPSERVAGAPSRGSTAVTPGRARTGGRP